MKKIKHRQSHFSFLFSLLKTSRGFSLLEAVISLGILGIILLSVTSMMQLLNVNSSRVSMGATKLELVNKIRINALHLLALESSGRMNITLGTAGLTPDIGAPNNLTNFRALADCMPSLATVGSCNKGPMEDSRGFRFYLSQGLSEDPNKAVAGEDVFYTVTGVRCNQTQAASPSECPISAMTWAEPFCSNFATACNKAIALTIRYKVALRPDFTGTIMMSPIEGEAYLPLTKGIQLSRLLSENDNPITMNSNGIYSVQKYYGMPDQAAQPKGLRFEAILGNPTGLVSMRLQYRAITGVDAAPYFDDNIPNDIFALGWTDVRDPANNLLPWTVLLTGAKPNQIINFGIQTSASSPVFVNKSMAIGATPTDSAALQAQFLWTINSSGNFVAPSFKSGYYQFRVLATDEASGTIESMNYITVRIVPRPQLVIPSTQPLLSQTRNCIAGNDSVQYSIGIADDEDLLDQTLKISGVDIPFSAVSGTNGIVSFPFDLSQVITGTSQNFPVVTTAKNKFTGRTVNSQVLTATQNMMTVTLSEKTIINNALAGTPLKIRLNTNGVASTSFETGSCCNLDPAVTWSTPNIPEVAAPLLTLVSNTAASCTLDAPNNRRTCATTAVVTGILESPAATASPDIAVNYTFSSGSNACTGGLAQMVFNNNAYIPVVKIPGIQFFLPESLWLTLPNNSIRPLKSFIPRVYVRADFDPDEDITVGVYKSIDDSLVCTIDFPAGAGTSVIDKPCNIPAGFSGDLSLKRITPNVMLPGDAALPTFRAKLISGKLNHRTCQPNLSSLAEFADYVNPTDQPMLNSPWGFTLDASFNPIQDAKNDAGLWGIEATKQLRCYDSWDGTIPGVPISYTFGNNLDQLNMNIVGNGDINVQDVYRIHRYNTEPGIKPYSWLPNAHIYLYSSLTMHQTYIFPDNPGLDFFPKNAPNAFLVWHNGSPGPVNWQFLNQSGAYAQTPPKPWTDYTPQLCSGSSALTTIKLLGAKETGHSTPETVLKAVNSYAINGSTGFYSYNFMCAYGRWNPFSKGNTNWSN